MILYFSKDFPKELIGRQEVILNLPQEDCTLTSQKIAQKIAQKMIQ